MFGAAWTWSKTMDLVDGQQRAQPVRQSQSLGYGKAGYDRTHTLVVNFDYVTPEAQQKVEQQTEAAQSSTTGRFPAVSSFMSGEPMGFTYSLVSTTDITAEAASVLTLTAIRLSGITPDITANAIWAKDQRTSAAGIQHGRRGVRRISRSTGWETLPKTPSEAGNQQLGRLDHGRT